VSYVLGQLLTESAAQYPDHVAVVDRQRHITYAELDALAGRLAGALVSHGVQRGDRVGIYLTKSIESIVAVFAILRAGATYVPLDPKAPVGRVAFIGRNCGMRALIASPTNVAPLVEALGSSSLLRCIVLTPDKGPSVASADRAPHHLAWQQLTRFPCAAATPDGLTEDDLAYLLYTSGSTGEPKGVMISHRASLTFVDWAHHRFGLQPADRVASHAPLHFDLSIFDVFATIKAGARIVLVPEEYSVFPRQLATLIQDAGITTWYSVPSVLTRLVLHGALETLDLSQLRQILFAGEVFPARHLRALMSLVPHAAYFNLYGPTETNVCTYHQVVDVPSDATEAVPIGKACDNSDVFAVDDHGNVAEPGQVGELYVRGPSLMKGYWGMPPKSDEALVTNPVGATPWPEKVYRTGDLVRQESTGSYLFLGRRDTMIKSRGYRIELGEIEVALYSHPLVDEAAAIAVPDDEMGNVIRAVVVPRSGTDLRRAELLRLCAERLPSYMLPASIDFMESLPKTSTGKVDKVAIHQVLSVKPLEAPRWEWE